MSFQPEELGYKRMRQCYAQTHSSLFLSHRYLVDNKMHIRVNKGLYLSIILLYPISLHIPGTFIHTALTCKTRPRSSYVHFKTRRRKINLNRALKILLVIKVYIRCINK